ncbi:MAG: carboxypeptidase-like regulatory domain-containing protein, partial [Bryocella sp.]
MGAVADPSGAMIPRAVVHVERRGAGSINSATWNSRTNSYGDYDVVLPEGIYEVTITANGFVPFVRTVTLAHPGSRVRLDVSLVIATRDEMVTVDIGHESGADASRNSLVLGPREMETMSDDDDTFRQQIQALAGVNPMAPSAMYVDGFSGGQFPSKDSIREIRINSNPYSAQYQEIGFGRIEILTKPGADSLHANLSVFANDSAFNSQNPYMGGQSPYYMLNVRGNISGPLGKKTSYFANFRYNDHQNNSVINALLTEDATNPFRKIVPSPDTSVDFSVRLDRQMSKNNMLTARWDFQHCGLRNGGLSGSVACFTGDTPPQDAVSSQVLPSQAFNGGTNTSTVQLTDSQNLGKSMVIETRFQWIRNRSTQDPVSMAGTVNVSGYFNGGGSAIQMLSDHTDNIEFQEYFSLERGQHFFRAGARYRGVRDANFSNANFNGVATYSAYKPAAGSGGTSATALANYTAGTPSKFVANVGSPHATLYTGDLALFVEDEYRVRKNVTLNYGMRLETQSAIPDHVNPAPRLSAAWDVGKTAKQQ